MPIRESVRHPEPDAILEMKFPTLQTAGRKVRQAPLMKLPPLTVAAAVYPIMITLQDSGAAGLS
jgi:hypothetical protein